MLLAVKSMLTTLERYRNGTADAQFCSPYVNNQILQFFTVVIQMNTNLI